jgi:hypothetical protein
VGLHWVSCGTKKRKRGDDYCVGGIEGDAIEGQGEEKERHNDSNHEPFGSLRRGDSEAI